MMQGGLSCKCGHPVIQLNGTKKKIKKKIFVSTILRSLRTTTGPRNDGTDAGGFAAKLVMTRG